MVGLAIRLLDSSSSTIEFRLVVTGNTPWGHSITKDTRNLLGVGGRLVTEHGIPVVLSFTQLFQGGL